MIILNTPTHRIEVTGRLPNIDEKSKDWRDNELSLTDWIVPTTDHPEHAQYLIYRQALRDWPSDISFPTTRPTL